MDHERAEASCPPQDQELVLGFLNGDQRAGLALVDRYYQRVLSFFRNKLPSEAHDGAQQTFAECFAGLGRLRDPARFRSFLFGVACNVLRSRYRARSAEGDRLDFGTVTAIDLDPSPSQLLHAQHQHAALLDGLRRIPIDHQIVLELFYWEEMTAAEIGEVLGLPLGTVKTRIARARQLLVKAMGDPVTRNERRPVSLRDLDGWARGVREAVASR